MTGLFRLAVSGLALTGLVAAAAPSALAADGTVATRRPAEARARAGARLWVARYRVRGQDPDSQAAAVVASPGGRTVFVTGSSAGNAVLHGSSDDYDLATVAYAGATGRPRWAARYRGPLGGGTMAAASAISPDGSTVYVTGQDFQAGGGPSAYVTVAYDAATGTRRWAQTFQTATPSGDVPDRATAIAVSPDGSTVYVTGDDVTSSAGGYSYGTVAYEAATGAQLWTATYAGASATGAAASGIAVSPDGSTVFVTGSAQVSSPAGSFDFATVAYRAATGAQLWARLYHGLPGPSSTLATAIAVSPHGSSVFVTGGTSSASRLGYATVSYDGATGRTRWARNYEPAGSAGVTTATAVVLNPAGTRVIVTGKDSSPTARGAYVTVAYRAASGARLWSRRDASRGFLTFPAAAMSPDGATAYLAYSYDDASYAVEALSAATGAERWRRVYGGLAQGVPDSIAVSPPGPLVFVTGSSLYGSGDQYGTVAYRG